MNRTWGTLINATKAALDQGLDLDREPDQRKFLQMAGGGVQQLFIGLQEAAMNGLDNALTASLSQRYGEVKADSQAAQAYARAFATKDYPAFASALLALVEEGVTQKKTPQIRAEIEAELAKTTGKTAAKTPPKTGPTAGLSLGGALKQDLRAILDNEPPGSPKHRAAYKQVHGVDY